MNYGLNWKRYLKSIMLAICCLIYWQASAPACAEEASDYTKSENWLAVPLERRHQADVFYIYPTSYAPEMPGAPLYCEIDDAGMRTTAPRHLLAQASVFETCADIYAPFYRQCDAMALAGLSQEEMIAIEEGPLKLISSPHSTTTSRTGMTADRSYWPGIRRAR